MPGILESSPQKTRNSYSLISFTMITIMNADGSKIIFFLGVAAAVVTAAMAVFFSVR